MAKKPADSDADAVAGAPGAAESKADDPKLLFYDAAGKRSSEPVTGGKQFLSDDPNRPDASKEEKDESGAKSLGNAGNGEDPELLYYDAAGKKVKEPVSGGTQYLPDDVNRPDSPESKAAAKAAAAAPVPAAEPDEDEADVEADAEEKAIAEPVEDKAIKSSANK